MPGWMGGTPAAAAWAQSEHTESVPFSRQKTAPAINHPPAAFQCLQSCSLLSQLHQSAAGFSLHSPGRALVSAHVKGLAKRSGFFLQLDSRHSRCSQPARETLQRKPEGWPILVTQGLADLGLPGKSGHCHLAHNSLGCQFLDQRWCSG